MHAPLRQSFLVSTAWRSAMQATRNPVGKGISELRIHYGPGYRVYFQRRGNTIIVLLCGGSKGTQEKDIKTALDLANEWKE